MSKEYKLKNETLIRYVENNEAKYAAVGRPTLISLEDCDIVALRTIKEFKATLIKELEKEKPNKKDKIYYELKYDKVYTDGFIRAIDIIKQT